MTSGTVEVFGPFETVSETTEPFPAEAPRPGLWLMTVFAGWSFVTKRGLTWKPCAWSVEVAWSIGRLSTFATAIGCGPFETLIRTRLADGDLRALRRVLRRDLAGRLARVDAVHVGLQVQPRRAQPPRPSTAGRRGRARLAFGRPVDTQIVTALPFGCRLPAIGSWL